MRFRLAIGAMMVCALMLAVEGAPLAGAAPKRVYKGKTAQKRPVRITMRGNTLKLRHFTAALRCRNGVRLIVSESGFVRTPIRRNGRFRDVQVGKTDEVFFKGRVRGKLVRGKVRVKDRLHKRGPRCASKWIGFRARLR
ncbi:MAG TPA: hypothetical protein VFT19_07535 [Solirubrobacterales bacterium]|nr:hypothetical protein [Solirubrobacterales bacterium]